jgi:hypothetical protein
MAAVISGAVAMMRLESLGPITTKARKRHMSPMTKPTRPERESHAHASEDASDG